MAKLILVILSMMLSNGVIAGTGFLKGEETSGLNKICYYKGASGKFAKTIKSYQGCPTMADDGKNKFNTYGSTNSKSNSYSSTFKTKVFGTLSGERVSGLNKICYYNSAQGTFSKTISSYQVCPASTTK